MSEAATVTPDEIRAYANLPKEVPDDLLAKHLKIGERDLMRATGVTAAPEGLSQEWAEAHTVCALASVFAWLNTFALSGAAKVGRLEGSVEYRFLTPEEVKDHTTNLTARFEELVAIITPNEDDKAGQDQMSVGVVSMIAI